MQPLTVRQQLRRFGISAEAVDGLVMVETDRTFFSLTPAELRGFFPHLDQAYRQANSSDPVTREPATC